MNYDDCVVANFLFTKFYKFNSEKLGKMFPTNNYLNPFFLFKNRYIYNSRQNFLKVLVVKHVKSSFNIFYKPQFVAQ